MKYRSNLLQSSHQFTRIKLFSLNTLSAPKIGLAVLVLMGAAAVASAEVERDEVGSQLTTFDQSRIDDDGTGKQNPVQYIGLPLFDIRKTFRSENAVGIVARSTSECQFPTATPNDLFDNLDIGWRNHGTNAAQNLPMGGFSNSERNHARTAMHIVSVAADRRSMVVEFNVFSLFHTDLPSYNVEIFLSPSQPPLNTPCIAQAFLRLGPTAANKTMLIREGLIEVRVVFFVPTGLNNMNLYGVDENGTPLNVRFNAK